LIANKKKRNKINEFLGLDCILTNNKRKAFIGIKTKHLRDSYLGEREKFELIIEKTSKQKLYFHSLNESLFSQFYELSEGMRIKIFRAIIERMRDRMC
jgi:hypothetical protein